MSLAAIQRDYGRVGDTNGKMPGSSYAVSPSQCRAGSKLAEIKGSVCHKCYALRIEKFRTSARVGWAANYLKATRMIAERPEQWAKAMAFQIERLAEKSGEAYHRWFDAGDLESAAMFAAIVRVAELTPHIKHWLPTREAAFVKAYKNPHPPNLIVRMSSTMVSDKPIRGHMYTSTVHLKGAVHVGTCCEARSRGNKCGPCRACWDSAVQNVSYPLH